MRLEFTRRTLAAGALAGAAALVAVGCGSGSDVQAKGSNAAAPPTATNAGPNGPTKSVRYRGLEFSVPSAWPVYNLESDPTTCVRFDVNAVYVGHPGADMQCPAVVVGRADGVLVEP